MSAPPGALDNSVSEARTSTAEQSELSPAWILVQVTFGVTFLGLLYKVNCRGFYDVGFPVNLNVSDTWGFRQLELAFARASFSLPIFGMRVVAPARTTRA